MTVRAGLTSGERIRLVERLTARIADYRAGEIAPPTAEHVEYWLWQFEPDDRAVVLAETAHVLDRLYYPRAEVEAFLDGLVEDARFAGDDPASFWRSAGFLRLQDRSRSQREMLDLLGQSLRRRWGFDAGRRAAGNGVYLYVDDGVFSGNQLRWGLRNWILTSNIRDAVVKIVAVGIHRSGRHWAEQGIAPMARDRKIRVEWWSLREIEDRRTHLADSEVLRPTLLPDDEHVALWRTYAEKRGGRFVPRPPGGRTSTTLFSSETARHGLEQAFLKKGAFIFSVCGYPDPDMHPLGYSRLSGAGFGTLFTTFRNCPNNAPLVLWWGDPYQGRPLDLWYPLLPRRARGT